MESKIMAAVLTGLQTLGEQEATLAGAVMAVKAAAWVIDAVKPLLPLLDQKYAGTPAGAQLAAAHNILDASAKVRKRILEYSADGRLTREVLIESLDDPAFAVFFKGGLSDASETDSELSHEQFALLVCERMVHSKGSGEAIKLRMAADRLLDLTDRHLPLIGAIFVAQHVFPDPFEASGSIDEDSVVTKRHPPLKFGPHWDVQIVGQDFDHLDAANILEIHDRRVGLRVGGERISFMLNRLGSDYLGPSTRMGSEVFTHLYHWMQGDRNAGVLGFKSVSLKQPGWIIGATIHSHLRGIPVDLGRWE